MKKFLFLLLLASCTAPNTHHMPGFDCWTSLPIAPELRCSRFELDGDSPQHATLSQCYWNEQPIGDVYFATNIAEVPCRGN